MLPMQAAEGPHTPQQSPPQAQVLRFGNFDQQDVAGGSASPARAAPPVRGSARQSTELVYSPDPAQDSTRPVCALAAYHMT